MKLYFVLAMGILPLAAADKPASKPAAQRAKDAPKPAAQREKEVPKPVEIPPGAVETQPGTFRHTDQQGKKWIYRKTPFGVARTEDNGSDAAAAPAAGTASPETGASREVGQAKVKVKATEDGDSIHFERPGPFGTYKW